MRSRVFVLLILAGLLLAGCGVPSLTPAPTAAPSPAAHATLTPQTLPTLLPSPTLPPRLALPGQVFTAAAGERFQVLLPVETGGYHWEYLTLADGAIVQRLSVAPGDQGEVWTFVAVEIGLTDFRLGLFSPGSSGQPVQQQEYQIKVQ